MAMAVGYAVVVAAAQATPCLVAEVPGEARSVCHMNSTASCGNSAQFPMGCWTSRLHTCTLATSPADPASLHLSRRGRRGSVSIGVELLRWSTSLAEVVVNAVGVVTLLVFTEREWLIQVTWPCLGALSAAQLAGIHTT